MSVSRAACGRYVQRGSKRKRRGARRSRLPRPEPIREGTSEAPASRRGSPEDRPPAPWGAAPLAELVILAGIVALAIGVIGGHPTAIGVGVAMAGLGGMEVAIRE